MKFGQQIKKSTYADWRYYYLDYDAVKKLLKSGNGIDGVFNESDELAFVERLEVELEKVASFRKIKGDELIRKLLHFEQLVTKILNSTTEDDVDRFQDVQDEISKCTIEVNELSKFIRLNYSGFLKVLKKHDKHQPFILKPMFNVRLASHPFYKDSIDPLIIKLSKLYDVVRTGGTKAPTVAPEASGSQNFVRRTTKYWVHPDNVTEVKCIILKYLPVLVFSGKANQEPNPAITSIYFDNDQFELYQGRIEKSEGAEALRLRWYGGKDQTEIFIERKTHREDWTGESSVKSRFALKEKNVNDYLSGAYSMDKAITKMRDRKLKSDKELDELKILADEIQNSVLTRKLHPMVRTFYNRTAFQLPGDARVRISLDTDLTMVREDNFGLKRSGDNWRRLDADEFPFAKIPQEDVVKFKHAILEVKLQTLAGNANPAWVDELVKSHLVEEVPKFSKFIHGVCSLLESRVSLLPFWLPQMDKDIRKPPPPGYVSQLTGVKNTTHSDIDETVSRMAKRSQRDFREDQRDRDQVQIQIDHDNQSSLGERQPLLDGHTDEDYDSPTESNTFRHRSSRQFLGRIGRFFANEPRTTPRQPQKRIALPVRIEPKVFFANERTFLSWLHFCIVLGGLALGLLNFGDKVGMISGVLFTLVAMMFMLYALWLYQWRAHKIRNRDAGPYDDRVGPTVLVVVLFFAVMINFYLKFTAE